MSIADNIMRVREEIDRAARENGRTGADVVLVGASKMNDAAACREAVAAGIDALGENRVQEMLQKNAEHAYDGAPLHFIGHLQRNKVNKVVGTAVLIQSAGSEALLREIEKAAAARGITQSVLLEVNIGGEEAKSGFSPEALADAAALAGTFSHILVEGVMTIPPADAEPAENRRYFDRVRRLFVDISGNLFHNSLRYLSMGMSGDYPDAIRAGATMVRVGTAIFGARTY